MARYGDDDAVKRWAQSQGLDMDDPRVQRYANSGANTRTKEGEDEEIIASDVGEDIENDEDYKKGQGYSRTFDTSGWASDDSRFTEAVERYAKSQGLSTDSPRVKKYARGLLGRTGDFGGREQDTRVGSRKPQN